MPETDNETFSIPFQRILLLLLYQDEAFYLSHKDDLSPEFFNSVLLGRLYTLLINHHENHGSPPSAMVVQEEVNSDLLQEEMPLFNSFCDALAKGDKTDFDYVRDRFSGFITRTLFKKALNENDDPCSLLAALQKIENKQFTNSWRDSMENVSTKSFLTSGPIEETPIIAEIAKAEGLLVLHGKGKVGKSTLAMHATKAIVDGLPFLDRPTIKQRIKVYYVNYEMSDTDMRKLIGSTNCISDNVYIINRPEPVLQLSSIQYVLRKYPPAVLVIDSFRGAFKLQGEKENSSGEAGIILRQLQELAVQHHWLIILIHHNNRSGKDGMDAIAGTGDWFAAVDIIWSLAKSGDDGKVLNVEGRLAPVDPIYLSLSPSECRVLDKDESKKKVFDALTGLPASAYSIAKVARVSETSARRYLDQYLAQNMVSRIGSGESKKDPYMYYKKLPESDTETVH